MDFLGVRGVPLFPFFCGDGQCLGLLMLERVLGV